MAVKIKQKYLCPKCKKRVFDAVEGGEAKITIKCSKCKEIVEISVYTDQSAPCRKDSCKG